MTAEYVSDNAKLAPWHDSPDAMVWAEKFVEMHKGKEIGSEDVDAGLMVGWFANAMATQITPKKVHDATEVPLMLDIIEKWHVRLGCTRVCDKMTSELYHYIHSKAEVKSTPQSVMTPPK